LALSATSPAGAQEAPDADTWIGKVDVDNDAVDDIVALYRRGSRSTNLWLLPGGDAADKVVIGLDGWRFDRIKAATGDFDADGHTDVAVAYGKASGGVNLWRIPGGPDGFGEPRLEAELPRFRFDVTQLLAIDLANGDDGPIMDLAITHEAGNGTNIWLARGSAEGLTTPNERRTFNGVDHDSQFLAHGEGPDQLHDIYVRPPGAVRIACLFWNACGDGSFRFVATTGGTVVSQQFATNRHTQTDDFAHYRTDPDGRGISYGLGFEALAADGSTSPVEVDLDRAQVIGRSTNSPDGPISYTWIFEAEDGGIRSWFQSDELDFGDTFLVPGDDLPGWRLHRAILL